MKVGRNEPCPCGSSKKYKKCCWSRRKPTIEMTVAPSVEDRIDVDEIGDYGEPKVDERFFEENPFTQFSAQSILCDILDRTELEAEIGETVRMHTSRWKKEHGEIMETDDTHRLVRIMARGANILNHDLLMERVLEREEEAMPLIME